MKFISVVFLLLFLSCNKKEKKVKSLSSLNPAPILTASINYDSCKKNILLIKQTYKPIWKNLTIEQKEKLFTKAVTETIIPVWIGTKWDFNGISEVPQQGYIACGYFVTTVLRDAGLHLPRVKLAQCASEQMIKLLIQSKNISRYNHVAIEYFVDAIRRQGYGLYIVGLDNHTGFIYNDGTTIYFIHSTFVGTRNVQKEKAADSWVLQQSKYKVLGKLSNDITVLNNWMD